MDTTHFVFDTNSMTERIFVGNMCETLNFSKTTEKLKLFEVVGSLSVK